MAKSEIDRQEVALFLPFGTLNTALDDRHNRVSVRRICSARYGFLYMSHDRDSDLLQTMAVMATRAEKKGKLCKEPQAV